MTRFVVDCGVVLYLASQGVDVLPEHELLAPTKLEADAFVTLDAELARRVEGIVPTATIEALRTV
jgi:hypothetical protein